MSKPTRISVEEKLLFEDPMAKEANRIENQEVRVEFGDGSTFVDSIKSARDDSIVLEESDVVFDVEWEGFISGHSIFEVVELQVFNDMVDDPESVSVEDISVVKE